MYLACTKFYIFGFHLFIFFCNDFMVEHLCVLHICVYGARSGVYARVCMCLCGDHGLTSRVFLSCLLLEFLNHGVLLN